MNLKDKTYYIAGIANKKSVAYFTAKSLLENGAHVICSGQTEEAVTKIKKLLPEAKTFICDVEKLDDIKDLPQNIKLHTDKLDGFLHSLAFANFNPEVKSYLDTPLEDFTQAMQISAFSLTQMCHVLKEQFIDDASIVTVSISNLKATSYGYMGPIKAMLENSVCYLAKAFSEFSNVRVNSVGAGPLKTSASAGIPNYIDNYLHTEKLTLRKRNLDTQEVANTILFLLSSHSSGVNAQNIIVDAGMSSNYFDQEVILNK